MKKFLLAALITLFSATSHAATDEQIHEVCTLEADVAGLIMEARQYGIPMSKVMSQVNDNFKPYVIIAYKDIKWSSEKRKQNSIGEMSSNAYLKCYESYGK